MEELKKSKLTEDGLRRIKIGASNVVDIKKDVVGVKKGGIKVFGVIVVGNLHL